MIKGTARPPYRGHFTLMESAEDVISPMEAMARRLATMAGVDWDRLREYPGYERNQWRHQAEVLIDRMQWARLQ